MVFADRFCRSFLEINEENEHERKKDRSSIESCGHRDRGVHGPGFRGYPSVELSDARPVRAAHDYLLAGRGIDAAGAAALRRISAGARRLRLAARDVAPLGTDDARGT